MDRKTPEELLGPLNDVEQKYAPDWLYVTGDVGLLRTGARVAVIGSRRASRAGLDDAKTVTEWLVDHGVAVISGLAEGVDTVAHVTAIQRKGSTIAVLGTPLDRYYPAANRALQDRIMRDHLAISQFALGGTFQKRNFPERNRTMALIAHASIIVEAGATSGTVHQGWEALRLGRPLLLLDSLVNNIRLDWPSKMMTYGAMSVSIDHLDQLGEVLPSSQGSVNASILAPA